MAVLQNKELHACNRLMQITSSFIHLPTQILDTHSLDG